MGDSTLELLRYIKEGVDNLNSKLDKHDDRIREVEGWQENANGKITAFGIVGVTVGSVITFFAGLLKG